MFVLSTLWLVDFFPLCYVISGLLPSPQGEICAAGQHYFENFFCQMQLYIAKNKHSEMRVTVPPSQLWCLFQIWGEKMQGRVFVSQLYKSSLFFSAMRFGVIVCHSMNWNYKCNTVLIFSFFKLIFLHFFMHFTMTTSRLFAVSCQVFFRTQQWISSFSQCSIFSPHVFISCAAHQG